MFYTTGMDYEAETRSEILRLLQRFPSQRALSRHLGLKPVTVNDLLLGKPMSDERLNEVRDRLLLPRVERTPVLLDTANEYVSRKSGGRKRSYVEFKVRAHPIVAEYIQAEIEASGCKSFSEWFLSQYPEWNSW